jgi:hypothetical protein
MATKRKTAVKKSHAPRRKKILSDVPKDQVFYCCDGQTLVSLMALASALQQMSDQVYAYHANGHKNDFYNWVADVVEDDELAEELADTLDRQQAADLVAERVAYLMDSEILAV